MPMSLTTLAKGFFPPGSFEAQQQERLRRIKKLKEEREREKYQHLLARVSRQQTATVGAQAKGTNNNNRSFSATPIVNKSASAKISRPTSLLSVSPVKKSKSTGVSSVTKKTKKSRSTVKFPSKSSLNTSTSRKVTTITSRKLSKQSTKKKSPSLTYSRIIPIKPSFIKIKSKPGLTSIPSTSKGNNFILQRNVSDAQERKGKLNVVPSTTLENKVTFSNTSTTKRRNVGKNSDFYCPVTSPVSILKNREKVNNLCKSTLKPSQQSLENLVRTKVKQSNGKVSQRHGERSTEMKTSYKPIHSQLQPPQPNIPICNAFPGTKEWDDYWANYTVRMEAYTKEMAEYERKGAEMFGSDIALFKKEALKVANQKAIYKHLGAKGVEVGIIPPPPIESKNLKGFQLFNGYIMKSKNVKGIVTNLPGSPTGVRFELDIRGIKPEDVLIQKDHNLLTLSIDQDKFLRIGTRSGKLAGDIEIWPPIDGLLIIDAP